MRHRFTPRHPSWVASLVSVAALSGLLVSGGCSADQRITSPQRPFPVFHGDVAPMPDNAVTVALDSLTQSPFNFLQFSGRGISFSGFLLEPGFPGPTGAPSLDFIGQAYGTPTISFTKPVSRVRVFGFAPWIYWSMKVTCGTSDGRTVSSDELFGTLELGQAPTPGAMAWTPLDVSGPGIRSCSIVGIQRGFVGGVTYVRDEAQPKLVLRCDGRITADTVVRGNRMRCAASTDPAGGNVSGTAWEFQDEQGHTITGPAGDTTWSGIMVVGGKVKLSGAVNGQAQTPVELAVTVTPRDWTGKISFPAEPQPEWTRDDPLKYPPTVDGDTLADGTLGKSRYPYPEGASGYGEGTGPNEGWYFFDQLPYFSPKNSHIFLNVALQPSDPFYQAQRGQPGQSVLGTPMCGQDFMRTAARHVPAHESGHYTRAKAFAEGAGAPLLESAAVFGTDPADDSTAYDTMLRQYISADSTIQADWDKHSVLRVPCKLTVPAN